MKSERVIMGGRNQGCFISLVELGGFFLGGREGGMGRGGGLHHINRVLLLGDYVRGMFGYVGMDMTYDIYI